MKRLSVLWLANFLRTSHMWENSHYRDLFAQALDQSDGSIFLFAPKRGKKEQKWAEQLDKINFFVYCWKLADEIFLIFCMKLKGIKGYKLPQISFLGIFLFCWFWPFLLIFVDFNFFVYCSKLTHYFFLYFA